MFDFNLTRGPEATMLKIDGDLSGSEDTDVLTEAFALLLPVEHLVLDLTGVHELDSPTAILIYDTLMRRSVMAESIVVSPRETVSMQLVLHDVDRVSPIVRTREDAFSILDNSWSQRRLPHWATGVGSRKSSH